MQNVPPLLVVGRTGQLARAMVGMAIQSGSPLVAVGRPELDLTDRQSIDRVLESCRPHAIVNTAAYTFVDKAETQVDLAFKINRDGARDLACAAERLRIPFVHVSTDYVFDGTKNEPYTEDDYTSPISVYGQSKRDGEVAVLSSNPAAVVVRTSWVYSPFGHNFMKTMLKSAQTRDHVDVVDDQHGAPTSAEDLARGIDAIVRQLEGKADLGGIYHLTAGGATTWYGFAATIFAEWARLGRRVPVLNAIRTADYPTRARRPSNSQLDCSKAAHRFGVRLPPWQRGLENCLKAISVRELSSQSC